MTKQPTVVVHPPDIRGLRAVTVDGSPAGSAWSLRDLRTQLCRAGLPGDMDLADRSRVIWREGGSDMWPDRAWRRRTVIAVMTAGLLASMVLLVDVGRVDAFGGLTFAGRITGFVFMFAGAVQGVAAAAAFDYWGKRKLRYSGALVLVGVLIAVATESVFLFMWAQEREYTPYLRAFVPISLWALWALWVLWRQRPWEGIPHPKGFTVGLSATALLASANFAYSAIYQPAATNLTFDIKFTYGKASLDPRNPIIYLPVEMHIKNTGTVPAYVMMAGFRVAGRTSEYDKEKGVLEQGEWRTDAELNIDTEMHVKTTRYRTLLMGPFITPGLRINPGDTRGQRTMVQIPKDANYDAIASAVGVILLRADRGRVDSTFTEPIYSWKEGTDRFFDCPAGGCKDYVMHHGRLRFNNNLINVTRRPRHVSAFKELSERGPSSSVVISSFNSDGKLSKEEESVERAGISSLITGANVIPFATLLAPGTP
ncbi:hypothetical protein ACFYYM_05025 [Streptomyces erythrochromogenes]|uniref:hypothetical protein n=1 Tax=Streptomyces erythrochromogenes TaxID=285574 RepID=UPI003684BFC6